MTYSIFCFSDAGARLAVRLCSLLQLDTENVHSVSRFAEQYGFTAHEKISASMKELFSSERVAKKLAAAKALADLVPENELCADYILPKAFDPRVREAVARARELGETSVSASGAGSAQNAGPSNSQLRSLARMFSFSFSSMV